MSSFDDLVQQFFAHYQDRDMMKWAGFYLSDHTQQLEKVMKTLNYQPTELPQLSTAEINQAILTAFNHHQPIIVQLNVLTASTHQIEEYQGYITQLTEEGFYLGPQQINLLEVHHIRFKPLMD